jgi:hypothetical protein
MVIGGGAENCFCPEEDTDTPCPAAGDAAVAADAEGLGSGLNALLSPADDGGVDAGLAVGAGACAAGAALWPQPARTTMNNASTASRM